MGLGKGNGISNGFNTADEHYQSIKTKGDTAVRRGTILQCIKEEAELVACLLFSDIECPEHCLLYFFTMNTNTSSTYFIPV